MKITHRSKMQSLILAAALSIGLGFVSPVGMTDLGTLGGSFSPESLKALFYWKKNHENYP
jgi:hypothetical protein